jgi:polar amino acid transport system substrate-binding protein
VFFAEDFEDPFREFDRILKQYRNQKINAVIVDAHTEATSEASALGWYIDGRAAVLYGTHTHIATADAKVLPQGTAYITDVGMTGLRDTVLGVDKSVIVKRFLTQTPVGFIIPETGPAVVNALVVNINPNTGQAIDVELVQDEVIV